MGSSEVGLTQGRGPKVAYVMSRFPKITETFVLYEALALEELGSEVAFFPLVRHRESVTHSEADRMESRVVRTRTLAWGTLAAVAKTALLRPRRFLRACVSAFRCSGGSWRHLVRSVAVFPKVIRIAVDVEGAGIEHVHAHFATHPALAARIIRDVTGIPYSFTAHGSDLHRDPRGLGPKVEGAALTVTVSDYNRRFIGEHIGSELAARVEVIRCGTDLRRFEAATEPTPHSPEGGGVFRIACVAALREVKGHTYLLAACERLMKDGLDFECLLVGSGPLEGELVDEIEARRLGSHVQLLGPKNRDEVLGVLRQSSVIALTSVMDREGRREGIPVSLMEGMAAGLPVVASDLSGIPELVEAGVSGLLVPERDDRAIAEALTRLSVDPEGAKRMGALGKERVSRDYDLIANARVLAERIGAVARDPRRPS